MRLSFAALLMASGPAFAATCPAYDADATGLTSGAGTTCGAGNDDRGGTCGADEAEDFGYLWIAPRTAHFAFDFGASAYDTVVLVRDFTTCRELACSDDWDRHLTSYVTFSATAGAAYYLQVDGFSADCGDFVWTLDELPCPDVDQNAVCDDADLCLGDDATGNADGDRVCDDLDACWGDDDAGDADSDGVCDDLDFRLQTTSILAGAPFTLSVHGAPAATRVSFLVSSAGGTTCHPSGALCLDLTRPVVLGSAVTDAHGDATIAVTAPPRPPRNMYFQAAWVGGVAADKTPLVVWPPPPH